MHTPDLPYLETLARNAGDILRRGFGQHHQIDFKGAIDLVTEVDRQSERYLLEEIARDFPTHQILAEESGARSGTACCRWYIDPLDGTVNYAHNLALFSVSIAYQENDQLKLGVVYDPMQDELFAAIQGQGAFLNNQPIRVSDASELDQSLLTTGFPYDIRTNPVNNLEHFKRFSMLSLGARRLGSAALDLSYVACGRFDGYWELRLSAWDIAAGGLIAAEAGAVVTDIDGDPKFLERPQSILAANPHIHTQMLFVLQDMQGRS